jgi:hypothetical protein
VNRPFHWLLLVATIASGAAHAAPSAKKRAIPVRKAAPQISPKKPVVDELPQTPGIMVPRAVTLTRATPAENRAHDVWTLRAALNVAALQCQYSPFLRTVDNYNKMLSKHSRELAAAQTLMQAHFRRTQKAGAVAFDRYNTRSYNSFSTLDAQYNFCQIAGQIGQSLRMTDVGTMGKLAETALPQLRAALRQVPVAAGLNVPPPPEMPDFRFNELALVDN